MTSSNHVGFAEVSLMRAFLRASGVSFAGAVVAALVLAVIQASGGWIVASILGSAAATAGLVKFLHGRRTA